MRISERALIARINRKLRPGHEQVHACRYEGRAFHTLGRHYLRDVLGNWIIDMHIDLEELGRELGVLWEWETLDDEVPAVEPAIAEQSVAAKSVQKNPE